MAANAQQGTQSQGQTIPGCNVVAQDRVWRNRVDREHVASKQWHEKWNFLTTDYEEHATGNISNGALLWLLKEREEYIRECPECRHLVRPQFPNRDPDKSKRQIAKNKLKQLVSVRPSTPIDQYITVLPSTKPVPKTTAGEIGWRSGDPLLALDKYGRYARPCGSILKQLNWPLEAMN